MTAPTILVTDARRRARSPRVRRRPDASLRRRRRRRVRHALRAAQGRCLPLPAAPLRIGSERRRDVPGRLDEPDPGARGATRPARSSRPGSTGSRTTGWSITGARVPPARRSPSSPGTPTTRTPTIRSTTSRAGAATSRKRGWRAESSAPGSSWRSAALPPAQRDAFLLHQEAGLELAAIAELTGGRHRDDQEPDPLRARQAAFRTG